MLPRLSARKCACACFFAPLSSLNNCLPLQTPPACSLPRVQFSSSSSYAKKRLKGYKFPEIRSEDCEEQHMRGWGPGGSNVNSAGNAVLLKHRPTKCWVKVHDSRNLHENIQIAQERLKLAVDRHLNADNSYDAQWKRLVREYDERSQKNRQKKRVDLATYKAEGEELRRRTEEAGGKEDEKT